MKLIILLAAVTWSNCAKLDNTYLPPSSAQTSGGSGNFLQAPISGSNEYQRNTQTRGPGRNFQESQNYPQNFRQNGFVQNPQNEFAQNQPINNLPQNQNAYQRQNLNAYSQEGNDFNQINGGFAPNNNEFSPNGNLLAQDGEQYSNTGNFDFNPEERLERAQAGFERNAGILRQDSQNDGETYSYAYETENGISAEESGVATNGVEAQGGFSYTGDDGQVYSIRYTADQNGFVPVGDHLPTPPPIPEEILRALEQNARDEAAGIYDDGTYNEAKYGGANGNEQYNNNNFGNANNNFGNANNNFENANNNFENTNNNNYGNTNFGNFGNKFVDGNDEDTEVTDNALLSPNRPGFRNQGFDNQNYRNQKPGLNQGFRNNQGFGNQSGATTAYLPPANRRSSNQVQSPGQAFNRGISNNQSFGNRNGASNVYLPPVNQRSRQNGFGRRQPASGRNGYQY